MIDEPIEPMTLARLGRVVVAETTKNEELRLLEERKRTGARVDAALVRLVPPGAGGPSDADGAVVPSDGSPADAGASSDALAIDGQAACVNLVVNAGFEQGSDCQPWDTAPRPRSRDAS